MNPSNIEQELTLAEARAVIKTYQETLSEQNALITKQAEDIADLKAELTACSMRWIQNYSSKGLRNPIITDCEIDTLSQMIKENGK